jgi:hypothetical protein
MIVSLAAAAVVAVAVCSLLARARGVLPTAARLGSPPRGGRRRGRAARLVRRIRDVVTAPWHRGRRRADDPPRTEEQEELTRVLRLATRSAGDAHHLLRPALADIARGRLANRGVDLDTEPERVRSLVGDRLADLLASDRPLPANFFADGIPLDEIESHVARLEAL